MTQKEYDIVKENWKQEIEVLDQIGSDLVKYQASDSLLQYLRKNKHLVVVKRYDSVLVSYDMFITIKFRDNHISWELTDIDYSLYHATKEDVLKYIEERPMVDTDDFQMNVAANSISSFVCYTPFEE